jgi:hypothetical protein
MSSTERYLQMGCSCGAEWIEDWLEPGPTCPWCDLKFTWEQLPESDRMGIVGPGCIDMSPDQFRQIMDNCSFVETKNPSARSRYDSSIWTHLFATPGTIWEITIEVTSFKSEAQIRSVTLSLRLTGNPVLFTAVLTADQLLFVLAAIARSMQTVAEELTPLAEGIFCGAPLEPV